MLRAKRRNARCAASRAHGIDSGARGPPTSGSEALSPNVYAEVADREDALLGVEVDTDEHEAVRRLDANEPAFDVGTRRDGISRNLGPHPSLEGKQAPDVRNGPLKNALTRLG